MMRHGRPWIGLLYLSVLESNCSSPVLLEGINRVSLTEDKLEKGRGLAERSNAVSRNPVPLLTIHLEVISRSSRRDSEAYDA